MAKFEVTIDKSFVKQLERLENFDELAEFLLNESADPLVQSVQREMSKHRDTGDMISKTKKLVKKNKWGWFLVVRPVGKDKTGTRNMEKLMSLEFGTEKQRPTPLLARSTKNAEQAVMSELQRNFDKYVNE